MARGGSAAFGAGHPFALAPRDQLLLAVVWLRAYPTREVLGDRFGVSDITVTRLLARAGGDLRRCLGRRPAPPLDQRPGECATPMRAPDVADSPDRIFAALVDAACYAA